MAFVRELTKETIHLPLGCLQGGEGGHGAPVGLVDVSLLSHTMYRLNGFRKAALPQIRQLVIGNNKLTILWWS